MSYSDFAPVDFRYSAQRRFWAAAILLRAAALNLARFAAGAVRVFAAPLDEPGGRPRRPGVFPKSERTS
jgi:hypothetical protein